MVKPNSALDPGSAQRFGLGLWSSVNATLAVELPIFLAGSWLYLRTTAARDGIGRWGLWGLVLFLAVVYFANLFGEPPPSVTVIAWVGQAQ